jgi:hypothetical protein
MKRCQNCSNEIQDHATFCGFCGFAQSSDLPEKHTKYHGDKDVFGAIVVFIGSVVVIGVIIYALSNLSSETVLSQKQVPTGIITVNILSSTSNYYSYSTIQPTPTIAYLPVTWKQLVNFLSDDHTNWNEYIPGKYVCLDFAVDLVENAKKKFIKAWIVGVEFTNGGPGHAFVAFETADRGIIYVEPQGDNTYSILEEGKPLCDDWGIYGCWGTVASYEYMQCQHSHLCLDYVP